MPSVLNDIIFKKQDGGLSRVAPGEDHISGLLFFNAAYPTSSGTEKFDGTTPIHQISSVKKAEALGITADSTVDGVKVIHYQVSEFFRVQPNSVLWVGIFPVTTTSYSEIVTMQQEANGKIRQLGIFTSEAFADTTVTSLQAKAKALEDIYQPLSIIYAADFTGIADGAALPNLRGLDAPKVSVLIGQDGGGLGKTLAATKSVPCLGACLGTLSKAQVHQNIGWVQEFDVAGGVELDTISLAYGSAGGTLYKDTDQTDLFNNAQSKGYIFLRKHIGISGSYFNDSTTTTAATGDFAYIENNRTIDKAIRGIRTALLPQLNAPLYVDGEGKLTFDTIKSFEALASRSVEQMRKDGELSDYSVVIDSDQDVLSDSQLDIEIKLVPVGVARYIEVSIGFAVSVAG